MKQPLCGILLQFAAGVSLQHLNHRRHRHRLLQNTLPPPCPPQEFLGLQINVERCFDRRKGLTGIRRHRTN